MSVRFRKSIGVGKGMRLNVGKRGISSASIKTPLGTSINVGKRGIRQTASIPGTGMSITSGGTSRQSTARSASDEAAHVTSEPREGNRWTRPNTWSAIGVLIILAVIVMMLVAG